MKKLLYIAVLAFIFNACGGDGDDGGDPTPTPTNNAPSTPSLTYPINEEDCIDNTITFEWNASTDPDNDPITYTVEIALNEDFSQIEASRISSTNSLTETLPKGVAYYWRVLAQDNNGAQSDYATAHEFSTEGEGESNHLPFAPSIVAPQIGSTVDAASGKVNLSWTASDIDGDALTFDVYFETGDIPSEASPYVSNISETSLEVDISGGSSYSWKVVVKDDKGGQTIGQIWNFKTD